MCDQHLPLEGEEQRPRERHAHLVLQRKPARLRRLLKPGGVHRARTAARVCVCVCLCVCVCACVRVWVDGTHQPSGELGKRGRHAHEAHQRSLRHTSLWGSPNANVGTLRQKPKAAKRRAMRCAAHLDARRLVRVRDQRRVKHRRVHRRGHQRHWACARPGQCRDGASAATGPVPGRAAVGSHAAQQQSACERAQHRA